MLNSLFSQCFNSSLPALSEDDCSTFIDTDISDSNEELFCTEEEVLEMLCTLDTSKATGPDGISAAMLKATVECITNGITALFNKSIESGEVPKDWKVSAIVPILKVMILVNQVTTDLYHFYLFSPTAGEAYA